MTKTYTLGSRSAFRLRRFAMTAFAVILVALGGLQKATAQATYCTTGLGGANYAWIDSVAIVGTTLQSGSGMAASYYNLFPASGNTTASLTMGVTYSLYTRYNTSTTISADAISSLWIDYNQDGTFAASEWTQITTNAVTATVSFTVPVTALTGSTRMRIRSRGTGNTNGSGDACSNFGSGETEDYTITIVAASACAGTPAATITSTATAACPNTPVTLSASPVGQSALTYQFQSNTGSGWTNLGTASASPVYTVANQTVATQYRVIVTCASTGGGTGTSTAVTVGQTPSNACYCIPTSGGSSSYYVNNFTTTGGGVNISNLNTGFSTNGYGNFTTQSVSQLQTQSISFNAVFGNSGSTFGFAVWVDWDQNGSFLDAGEKVFVSSAYQTSHSGSFAVPLSAIPGNTRMRIGCSFIPNTGPADPCANTLYTEFEDYTFNVIALTPCTGTPAGGTAAASPAIVCPNATTQLSAPGSTIAGSLAFQWKYFNTATSTWDPVVGGSGATTNNYTTGPVAATTQFRLDITCTPSGITSSSTPVTVTVTSYAPPYSETFESVTTEGQMPNCMSTSNVRQYSSDGWWTYTSNSTSSSNYRINHTTNGSKYATMYYYNKNEWLFTPGLTLQAGKTYQMKFWYITPSGSSIFSSLNVGAGTAANAGAMTVFGTINNPNNTTYQQGIYNFVCTANGTYNFGINVVAGTSGSGYPGLTVDDIEVYELPPCSGRPVAGTIIRTPSAACPGTRVNLTLSGSSIASGLSYQWQQSPGTGGGPWTNAIGTSNRDAYQTPVITNLTTSYRLIITCANGGQTDTSAIHTVVPYAPVLPYFETFESIVANNQLPNCMQATSLGTNVTTYATGTAISGTANHTISPPGSKYATMYEGYQQDNWLFTSKIPLIAGKTYKMSFWYRSSTSSPNVRIQSAVGTGPNVALMQSYITNNTGATTTYVQTSGTYKALLSGDYVFGINVASAVSYSGGYISIDDILIEELPPCTGAPTVSITPQNTITLCPTATVSFTSPQPVNSGLTYQWQYSTDSTFPNTPVTVNILNANNFTYSGPALPVTAFYRLKTYCTKSNGVDSAYSNVVKVIITPTLYAPLPYVNDFETWVDYCDNKDVPSGGNWVQSNKTGNSSWRRNDQGSTANWTSPTAGAYTPAAKSGTYSARFHSSNADPSVVPGTLEEGMLDMYVNCSGTDTNKTLYFYHINPPGVNSVTNVSLSTDGGLTFNQIAGYDTAAGWRLRVIPFQSDRPATIIRFSGRRNSTNSSSDIGIDSVYVAPPCVGQPVAGTIGTNSPASICAGDTALFNLTGTSFAGNLLIEWQASTTSATAGFATYQSTFGNYRWVTPPLLQTTWVRARVLCRGSNLEAYSNVIQLDASATPPAPAYAALPFLENFESWTNRCSNTDIPSANWANVPNTGNRSWRRNDQGSTAGWANLLAGQWWPGLPAAAVDSYSARFHNASATPNGSTGALYSYVNCSTVAGDKELRFFVNMPNRTPGNTDSLQVSYSRDGGLSFNRLGIVRSTTGWEQKVFMLPSDSAKTVIRFRAISQSTQQDIGIDYVQVLPPCSGAPIAGTVDSVADVCPNRPFNLSVRNVAQAGNLAYTWERSTAGPTSGFTPIANATTPFFTTSITQNTWFRLRVRCGQDSTYTAARLVKMADFYYCYCQTNPQYPITATQFKENIGNVTLRNDPSGNVLLTNGIASPISSNPTAVNGYSNFQNLPSVPMYRDSTYRVTVQQISYGTNSAATVAGWIDFNRDGVFDPLTERILNLTTSGSGTTPYQVSGTFQVPSNATPGLTGMRLTLMSPTGTPTPCGTNPGYGETEDYLIELRFAPCSGFSNVDGGTAYISDTAICLGYPVTLWDTSYQKEIYGITRQWQRSVNNGASWQTFGPTNTDTVSTIVQANTIYRYAMFCNNGAASYSNTLSVSLRPSTECYCPSFATGGADGKLDSTDIGSVSISSYTFQQGGAGPHLLNPAAVRKWTNHADNSQVIHLWADSTYELDVYQIIRGATHKNAKVTVFIDYNQDLSFQVNPPAGYPSERILTAYTAANNYYLDNMIVRIPNQQVIQNVPTLMRIILNEDTGPSVASDEGCGTYLSGETEDFRVMFHCAGCPLGVNAATNVTSFNLFPNPTTGTSKLELNTQVAIKEVEMTVTTMTGQVLQKKSFSNVGTRFETTVDLKEHARGVYFVELKADNERIVRKLVVQ